jgi:hypothetical protein
MQTSDDLYYNVIRREDMERRFPGSKRTYTRLKDMELCGGDMNMARTAIVDKNSEFWDKIIEARKNPAAQAWLIGPDIIFKLLFRQLTIDDVIQRVADKLGLKGRAIICPYPEVGMDVDKPHQLELMRADLTRRIRKEAEALAPKPRAKAKAKAKKKVPIRPKSRKKTAAKVKPKSKARPKKKTARPATKRR